MFIVYDMTYTHSHTPLPKHTHRQNHTLTHKQMHTYTKEIHAFLISYDKKIKMYIKVKNTYTHSPKNAMTIINMELQQIVV